MRFFHLCLCRVVLLTTVFLLPTPSASASTIIPPRNLGELARLSDAVVLVRAGSAESFARGRTLYTLTDFEVLRSVSGPLAAGEAVSVASLGGKSAEVNLAVAGAPRFQEGRTYLLFLDQDERGTWRPRLLSYGLLEQTQSANGQTLLKPLAEAEGLAVTTRLDGVRPEEIVTYRQEALLGHLGAVVRKESLWNARQALAPAELLFDTAQPEISFSKRQNAPDQCRFLEDETSPRWQKFDVGEAVEVYVDRRGDNVRGRKNKRGFAETRNAIENWNSIDGASIRLAYGGKQNPPNNQCEDVYETGSPEGSNYIAFDDPCDEIPEAKSADDAQTLALGGVYYGQKHSVDGEQWYTVTSLYLIINQSTGDLLSSEEYTLMLTHELGHGLGFDHHDDPSANMNGTCCNEVNATDQECALFAYDMQYVETGPLPVELADFEVQVEESAAHLTWQTASETGNSGFQVEHALEDDAFAATGFVEGYGTTTEPQHYAFTAADLLPGRHRFRLKQIDLDGAFEYSPEVEVVVGVPEAFVLSEAYPNPFNPRAQFTLAVAAAQHVQVALYDVRGRQVALLHDGMLEADRAHRFTLEADGLPSGVYFYRAIGETFQAAKPATLLK